MPKVSVIIPTYNRIERLKAVLAALEQQTYPLDQVEVLVVSDGSTDGTDIFLNGYHGPLNLTPLFHKNQGPAASRNLGITQACGEIILFIDDDVVPVPDLVHEHLKIHAAQGPNVVVLGPMLTPPDSLLSPWTYWEQEMLMKQYTAMTFGRWQPTSRQFYTGNSSLARRHLEAAGGFDAAFRRAEDVELAYRLESIGLTFFYHPQAVGYHYANRNFGSWSQIAYDYGQNDVTFHQFKGYDWLLPTLFREFKARHVWTRALVRLCLDRTRLSGAAIAALKWIAAGTYRLSLRNISRQACSGIFNLRYFQGIADGLGGRDAFMASLKLSPPGMQTSRH